MFPPPLTELSAARVGWSHFNCAPRLLCAVDWWILSRERIQPPSAGVQPSHWKLDHCPSYWHTTYRFLRHFVFLMRLFFLINNLFTDAPLIKVQK